MNCQSIILRARLSQHLFLELIQLVKYFVPFFGFSNWLQRFAAKRSGGLNALNCLNAQCLLIAQLFIYALPPPFFLGAVMGWFYNCYSFFEPKKALAIEPISET